MQKKSANERERDVAILYNTIRSEKEVEMNRRRNKNIINNNNKVEEKTTNEEEERREQKKKCE